MNIRKITKQLKKHEGLRLKPYSCSAGRLTIGYGRNIEDKGITESEAGYMLLNDIHECNKDLHKIFIDFDLYPENIQRVLLDMRFQLGIKGFRGFKLMIKAVKNRNWAEMIRQMKDSAWFRQTPKRANDLILMVNEVIN